MFKTLLRALLLGLLVGATNFAAAASVALSKDHPDVYYVKEGDTLWDIATSFLQNPWEWPAIWQKNEQVTNPHLIYPGDELRLVFVGGEPYIDVTRGEQGQQADQGYETVRLSPQAKEQPLSGAIPTVALDSIQTFLLQGLVVDDEQIEDAPYLLGGVDSRENWGRGDTIYVRDPVNQWKEINHSYSIYRVGDRYIDPDSKEILGNEAIEVGQLKLIKRDGDIATMLVETSRQNLQQGDRIFSAERHQRQATYFPKAPSEKIDGQIIRLFGAVQSVARNDVVAINRGTREGLQESDILQIMQPGEVVHDKNMKQFVRLPSSKAGTLLLFRVFDKVSYGLIVESFLPVNMADKVINPE